MAARFFGNCPSNVRKDAKYSVVHGADGMEVRLIYRLPTGERALITTASHPDLVQMVNHVKEQFGGHGGAFYINEFHQVLVPSVHSGCFLAGEYHRYLKFELDGAVIGPEPDDGLRAGDTWSGPKVGIPYILTADACDIKYKSSTGPNLTIEKRLSDVVGSSEARRLGRRLSRHKPGGGRIYINEASQFFAPVQASREWRSTYLGGLEGDSWFAVPEERRT